MRRAGVQGVESEAVPVAPAVAAAPAVPAVRRRVPLQARGQATVESILDAAATLIEALGHEAITTNLIAREAGVNIATLYQYFANKQAILVALFDRQTEERHKSVAAVFVAIRAGVTWRQIVSDAIDAVVDMRRAQVGSTGVRRAICSMPDLREHDRLASIRLADGLAERFVAIATGVDFARAQVVARCTVEMLTSVIDLWSMEVEDGDMAMIAEAKTAVLAYLGSYLEPRVPVTPY